MGFLKNIFSKLFGIYTKPKGYIRVFTYGTLKRGHGNYDYYLKNDAKFVGTDAVWGEMYTLGAYPVLFKSGEHEHFVPGEVFDVAPEVFKRIKAMEEGAGYTTSLTLTKKYRDAYVFFHTNEGYRKADLRIKEF